MQEEQFEWNIQNIEEDIETMTIVNNIGKPIPQRRNIMPSCISVQAQQKNRANIQENTGKYKKHKIIKNRSGHDRPKTKQKAIESKGTPTLNHKHSNHLHNTVDDLQSKYHFPPKMASNNYHFQPVAIKS